MSFSFVSINEPIWHTVRAVETSLSVSEIASKAGLKVWEISRILSLIKNQYVGIRLSFEVNFEKVGLLEIATISVKNVDRIPYLRAQRILRILGRKMFLYTGLLPAEDSIIEEWLSTFEEGAITVRALERKWWKTDTPATAYREEWVYGNVEAIDMSDRRQPATSIWKENEIKLDDIDVFILWAKSRWPFTPLREIERESEKYLGRRLLHQILSQHFRNNVLKLWVGNRVWLYADAQQIPYRLTYMEGRDAPAVARALVQLPWFHTAYIDIEKAVVSGQPPCASMPHLYRVLGDLDVDVLEFAMEVSTVKWVPYFSLLSQIVKRKEVVNA
jgi:hypothetical protein